jgi:hypothetical protein
MNHMNPLIWLHKYMLFSLMFLVNCWQDHYEDLVRYLFVMNGFGKIQGVFFNWDPPKNASQ